MIIPPEDDHGPWRCRRCRRWVDDPPQTVDGGPVCIRCRSDIEGTLWWSLGTGDQIFTEWATPDDERSSH